MASRPGIAWRRLDARAGRGRRLRRLLVAVLWLSAASAAAAYFARGYLAPDEPRPMSAEALADLATQAARADFQLHEAPRPLPALAFSDGAGDPVRLGDFRGRTLLLNVWATWCAPCRREMPALDRLQAALGGADFQVIALSTDAGGAEAVRAFYRELGIGHLDVYVQPAPEALQGLGLVGLPTTLLIGPEGRELGRMLGAAEWDSAEMVKRLRSHLPDAAMGRR